MTPNRQQALEAYGAAMAQAWEAYRAAEAPAEGEVESS